ncbi:MAG: hypothetical protein IJB28_02635 [Bacteroidaceae bacterium]|nr:hypothetical protein [Bacteroidaceae bacterium]
MKNRIFNLLAAFLMLPAFAVFMTAANGVQTVGQVTGTVSLTAAVDYTITGETPFADGAVLDIVNTDEAVVILPGVKPSQMLEKYLKHIRINGAAAVKNSNCMVKIYADGCIVLPHGTGIKPLTVYAEKGQTGKSAQFGVSTHQSLAGHAMNNKIQSFTLKRGYMAWFGTKSSTRDPGYNRIFIADKADITVDLPVILCNSISALRVSQWNDASKKGYCSWQQAPNELLNTTWHYNWDAGINPSDDREYVTQQHHRDKSSGYWWPSFTEVGNNGTSANVVTYNEPDNTGDDREHPATVQQVLDVWPELMSTGRRLGSPAVAGNLNWLYEFMDSIDARGWRCDFVVMHCYWYSDWPSWNGTLSGVKNRTGRPIWITEMNYGANWTDWPAGKDRTGSAANYAIHLQHFAPIIDGLEATQWLERYCVYNAVEPCRYVIDDNGKLTPSGEYYANKKSGMAYNSMYNVVPKLPKMKAPANIMVGYDSKTTTATITWREYNGEYNESMQVQRRVDGSSNWETIATVTPQEAAANYTYQDTESMNGYQYRVMVVDAAGKSHYTSVRQAVLDKVEAGDAVQVNGQVRYAGGNLIPDGDFELGAAAWTDGKGAPVSQSAYFSVFPVGGVDGGAYLHARNQKRSYTIDEQALVYETDVEAGRNYYFSMALIAPVFKSGGMSYNPNNQLQLTGDTSGQAKKDSTLSYLKTSDIWAYQEVGFNASTFSRLRFTAANMAGQSQFDKVVLCPLFDTKDEAIAHGIVAARAKATYVSAWLANYPELQTELQEVLAMTEGGNQDADLMTLELAMTGVMQGARAKDELATLIPYAEKAVALKLDGHQFLQESLEKAKLADSATEYVESLAALQAVLDDYLPAIYATDLIASPTFNRTSVGWTLKCGTYTGGDQRINSDMAGKSCWNAWWSGQNASEGKAKTMEIRQTVKGLAHGVYSLECKAGTQNNCLTDQHAYLVSGEDTLVSANLTYDRLDLPTVADSAKWETLMTPPVYVGDKGELTFGFIGSKQGAVDNAWKKIGDMTSTGDKREGWWCATDFALRFIPMYRTSTPEGGWGVICLPRAIKSSERMKLYHIEGILADYSALCLQEVTETEAGVPYIYYTDEAEANFYEEGETVDMPSLDDPVWGDFYGNMEAFPGEYYLENGQWHRATLEKTGMIWPYTAFIPTALEFAVYESWDGQTMPINGAAEEHAQGIRPVLVDGQPTTAPEGCYTLSGMPITEEQAKQCPMYIRVKDGRAVKVVAGY